MTTFVLVTTNSYALQGLYKFFLSSPLLVSFAGLVFSFLFTSPRFTNTKQTSWIVTTISSFVMSIASLPFLWDYILGGGSVQHIRTLPALAVPANRFFQSYLAADLILGVFFYRSRITPFAGWAHHSIYIMVVELAIRRSWSHIFCLCASMEIPTFILGFTTLYPRFRNNILFAYSFFTTRILFHIVLTVIYFSKETRVHATGGSFIPAVLLAVAFPLHVLWFIGCIKGFVRRATEVQQTQRPPVIDLEIIPGPTPPSVKGVCRTWSSSPARDSMMTKSFPKPFPRSFKAKPPYHQFYSLRSISEKSSPGVVDSRFRETRPWSSRMILPCWEIVYEYAGLGRSPNTSKRGAEEHKFPSATIRSH